MKIVLGKPKSNRFGHPVQKIYETDSKHPIFMGSSVWGGRFKGTVTTYKRWKLHSDPSFLLDGLNDEDVEASQRIYEYVVSLEVSTGHKLTKWFSVEGWWAVEKLEIGSDYIELMGYPTAKNARSEMLKWIKQHVEKLS